MRLRDVTIRSKLYGLALFSALGVAAVLGLALWCLATFRVNGPVYREIVRDKDVVADILPPPLYVVEPYLVLHEVNDESDPARVEGGRERIARLETEFDKRSAYWSMHLEEGALKHALLDEAGTTAREFFRLAREEYFPARARGDRAAATAILMDKVWPLHRRHREQVDHAVELAARQAVQTERDTASRVSWWTSAMVYVSVASVLGLLGASLFLARNIVRSTRMLIGRVDEIANGAGDVPGRVELDRTDELGRLAAGINGTIDRMKGLLEQARAAADEATHLRLILRNVIDSMPSALIGVDGEGRVTQWNREAERLTGVPERAAVGRELAAVLPQLKQQVPLVSEAVADRKVQKVERLPWDGGGDRGFRDVTVYPLVTSGVRGAVVRVDDVTTRVRMEEAMVRAEKMRSVGALAAGVAHEINNPLAGAMQGSEVVLRRIADSRPENRAAAERCGTTPEALHAYMHERGIPVLLEQVRASCGRAAEIVANMLCYSRSEAHVRAEPHDLATVVDQAVGLQRGDYDVTGAAPDFKNVDLVVEHDRTLPPVPCKPNEIQQVVINLLKNATHAVERRDGRSGPPRILIRTRREGDMARVDVEDNGSGMPESVRRQVFEPFFTTKGAKSGTGLGLFVSYCIIVRNYGGTIEVDSAEGVGTRFSFTLPLPKE